MSIVLNCPHCAKRYELNEALAGKKVRCSGCDQVFRVQAGEMRSSPAPGSKAPPKQTVQSTGPGPGLRSGTSQAIEADELVEHGDSSWLEDGAGPSESMPPPIRRARGTTAAAQGPNLGLLLGLGAAGLAVVGVIAGLLITNSGSSAPPASAPAPDQASANHAPARSLTDRILVSVGAREDPATDIASYPAIGPLLPPCLPPPPLRDLSAHERQTRLIIGYIGRMNNVLAGVHDVPSMKAAGEQLKSLSQQMSTEMRQNDPGFRLTAAEDAELSRRVAADLRNEMEQSRKESARISTVPGLAMAGVQLVVLVTRLSLPLEQSLRRAESFKPQTRAEPYAEVYVQLQDGDAEVVCRRKLHALLERAPGIQAAVEGETKRASYRVWPVEDVRGFARKITFGKTTVKDRNIFVVADPISAADIAAAKDAEKKEEAERQAAFQAARTHENPNDPKPPAGADEVTKALFALRSSSPERRKQAVQQLYDLSPKENRRDEVQKQLTPFLDDQDGFFVNDVMRTMARWRTEETVPALIKKLDDSRHGVRWKAAEILGKIGDARAAGPLAEHLKHDGIATDEALRKLGPAAEPALIALLKNPDADLRRQACDLLRDLGGKEALLTMISLPADRDPLVQMAARSAMQAIRQRVGPVSLPRKSGARSKGR